MSEAPKETTRRTIVIQPAGVAACETVRVLIQEAGDAQEMHHITLGDFLEGNVPEVIDRRFDFWENLAGDRPRVIEALEESYIASTTEGRGEVQQAGQTSDGRSVVRVIYHDGHSQKYVICEETATVWAQAESIQERDGEAKLILQHFLDVEIERLTYNTSTRATPNPDPEALVREMKRSTKEGYVLTDEGEVVEPDHPESPLQKAGVI